MLKVFKGLDCLATTRIIRKMAESNTSNGQHEAAVQIHVSLREPSSPSENALCQRDSNVEVPASQTQHSGLEDQHDSTTSNEPDQQHYHGGDASNCEHQDLEKQLSKDKQYSTFTVAQKKVIILSVSAAAFFSPLTGSIYFPAISTIATALHTSSSKINLTVTTYLIFQGVSPMVIAGFSDNVGRRPAYIICFAIYIIANLALGLNNTYGGLLGVRCLQSAGSSGTVAFANGVVADLVTSAERGEYIAFASLAQVLGPSLSPVIGGLIANSLNWHWIFWFLLILSVSFAIPFLLFFPETGRKVVDDGSIPPPRLNWNLFDHLRHANRAKKGLHPDPQKLKDLRSNYHLEFPNPLPSLKILIDLESALILSCTGMGLACFYAISTGASASFRDIYGFNDIQIALMFLPIGAGGILSAFTTGRLIDWNFRRWCKKSGVEIRKGVKTDLSNFPVERARLEVIVPLFITGLLAVTGYGWMLEAGKISLAGPAIMFFLLGYALMATSQGLNVLMMDIWPGKAAAATGANNLTRCLLGAAASAAVEPMRKAVGYGGTYSILGGLALVTVGGMAGVMRFGMGWRAKRAERERKESGAGERRQGRG